ncbi:Protein phosphatase PP2A regulatory subunit A [Cyberlindnera fabianii]|uniref:Protein phosphatase PP2A regulatory subunit A n=1 Tax=Cyberlindnera fabianii TaxID=36022 RepID=A0A1V2LB65_CYBFA|nr:Protein phosphatase PP2A regulatory subunit A [Cyberlindnera fabianii]
MADVSTDQNDDIYPLALLMDELKHDDVTNRVNAMQKLDTIALALGPERTREELIPFLQEVAQDDEDEVFAVLAEQLGRFVPLIGGSEHAEILIPVLELLAATEEPVVRDKAVDSLNEIASQLSLQQIGEKFYPLVEDLAGTEWFSSRVSATGLFQSIIVKVDDTMRKNLLTTYSKLVHDEGPMVKRAAATHLPKIIDLLRENPDCSNEQDWDIISSMFQTLTTDKQDSVKFLSVDVLISILQFFNSRNDTSHHQGLLNSALSLIQDPSWRVRYMAADRFEKLATQFESDYEMINELIDPFLKLLKDNEGEVRKAIAKQLPGFCKLIKQDVLYSKVIWRVEELSRDPSEFVRSALASEITGLTPLMEKEVVMKELLPILLTMLKDEYPEVKLNVISKLKVVNDVIGIDILAQHLLPAITELARDKQWRVRLAIIEYIPLLADQLGVSFFGEELGNLVLSWLWDSVYSIREAAVTNLEKLAKIFGSKWADEEIIERILKSDEVSFNNFVYRLTSLFTLTRLIPVVDKEIVITKILPFVDNLASDQVPNIRFNVAKSYLLTAQSLLNKLPPSESGDVKDAEALTPEQRAESAEFIKQKVLPVVESLKSDADADVKYFATQSYDGIVALLEDN